MCTCEQLGAQVRDVTGGQAQGLDLRQLAVRRLRGDEGAQHREGRVDTVQTVQNKAQGTVHAITEPVQSTLHTKQRIALTSLLLQFSHLLLDVYSHSFP